LCVVGGGGGGGCCVGCVQIKPPAGREKGVGRVVWGGGGGGVNAAGS